MTFEEYLISKKIDSAAFRKAEEKLWCIWKEEFAQMHPNSFTVQKLNLINPIRRKYQLKTEADESTTAQKPDSPVVKPDAAKPSAPKPVFKPKPKIG